MEKRREPRTRTLKKARIVFNDGRSVIDCVVRNLSPHGAMLVLPSLLGVPETFELHIDSDGSCHAVRMRWVVPCGPNDMEGRSQDRRGVRVKAAPCGGSSVPCAEAGRTPKRLRILSGLLG
jgi:PilZ domain-containing protein